MASRPRLPTIITTDNQNDPAHPPETSQSISSPICASPQPIGASSSSVPPSPTLSSFSSVHWADSRDLRDNRPDPGPSLLDPSPSRHRRQGSLASYASTTHHEKQSYLTLTRTGTSVSPPSLPRSQLNISPFHIDSSGDTTDPTPFEQKPLVLASLVDPKSLHILEAMGGVEGLLRGLGTDTNLGLRNWQYSDPDPRHDPEKGECTAGGGDKPQSRATAADRHRVYGVNQTPPRKSKSLLLLVWLAAKDKVLVSGIPIPRFM